jgi:hypothetical protein
MREIKFRVWVPDTMIYPEDTPDTRLVSYKTNTLDFVISQKGLLLTLYTEDGVTNDIGLCGSFGVAGARISFTNPYYMEYTGLKDSAGKEIYEGDIVYWNTGVNGSDFDPFVENYEKVYYKSGCFFVGGEPLYRYDRLVNIVGNIFQNKELLNK